MFNSYISGSQSFSNPERSKIGWLIPFFRSMRASSGSESPKPKTPSVERALATSKRPCP